MTAKARKIRVRVSQKNTFLISFPRLNHWCGVVPILEGVSRGFWSPFLDLGALNAYFGT